MPDLKDQPKRWWKHKIDGIVYWEEVASAEGDPLPESKAVMSVDVKEVLLRTIEARYQDELIAAGGQLWVSRNGDEVRRHVLEATKRYEAAVKALEEMLPQEVRA